MRKREVFACMSANICPQKYNATTNKGLYACYCLLLNEVWGRLSYSSSCKKWKKIEPITRKWQRNLFKRLLKQWCFSFQYQMKLQENRRLLRGKWGWWDGGVLTKMAGFENSRWLEFLVNKITVSASGEGFMASSFSSSSVASASDFLRPKNLTWADI